MAQANVEPLLEYHSECAGTLTPKPSTGWGTLSGGQFDWGGRLLKCNGGAQRFPQAEWKPAIERIGIRGLDCETDMSSRGESRSK